jgi:hypothetical protein
VQNSSLQSTPIHKTTSQKLGGAASTLSKDESKQTIEPSSLYRIYDMMMRNKQLKTTAAGGTAAAAALTQKRQLAATANSDEK